MEHSLKSLADPAPLRADMLNLRHSIEDAVPMIPMEEVAYRGFLHQVAVILEGTAVVLQLLQHVVEVSQRQAILTLIDHLLASLCKQTLVFVREI